MFRTCDLRRMLIFENDRRADLGLQKRIAWNNTMRTITLIIAIQEVSQ